MSDTKAHPVQNANSTASLRKVRAPDGGLYFEVVERAGSTDDSSVLAEQLDLLSSKLSTSALAEVLQWVNDNIDAEEDPSHSSLTEAESEALRAAGSLVDAADALPVRDRPSMHTALREQQILAEAFTTDEVARLLGVSTSRVRQRSSDRSLFTMHSTHRGLRFPRFQFTADSELSGWGSVSKALPEAVSPVAVEYFLTHTHPDLADGELTPTEWLAAGRPAEKVAALAEQTFTLQ